MDTTYRSDLDRLNQLNFARFDAKLEQRLAELEAKLDMKWKQRMSHFEVRMQKEFAALRTDMVRWTFAFWTGTMLALAGFIFAIWKTRPGP